MVQTPGALPLLILLTGPLFLLPPTLFTSAHGYLSSPRSRNFRAKEDGLWWGGPDDGPYPESCPHCLNRKPAAGTCGGTYDVPKDMVGRPMEWKSQAEYDAGQVVVVDATLTAHHRGHMEMYACDVSDGSEATTACFEEHPLTFVRDLMYDGPEPDPVRPERAYVAPNDGSAGGPTDWGPSDGMQFSFEYRLPSGVSGSRVLLQWRYYTANTCEAPGYDSNKPEWQENSRVPCGPMDDTGDSAPERFWNCAEVTIGGGSPTASPAPTVSPVVRPTAAPTATRSPTRGPTTGDPTSTAPPVGGGTCGGGMQGNGLCPDPALCCSEWGHCGSTPAYCGPDMEFTASPTGGGGTCGGGMQGNGLCPDPALCCSEWGHCGSTPAYCGPGMEFTDSPTGVPSSSPTASPTSGETCSEEPTDEFMFKIKKKTGQATIKKCQWLANLMDDKPDKAAAICKKKQLFHTAEDDTVVSPPENTCPVTCGSCDVCYENPKARFFKKLMNNGNVKTMKCKQLKEKNKARYCASTSSEGGYPPARDQCPQSCSTITGNC